MKRIPAALVLLRALCGPALVGVVVAGGSGRVAAVLVTVAFLSDVFDGIIARRIGVATERLRRADTLADTAFYACAAVALYARAPGVLRANAAGLAVLLALEVGRLALERRKYGRLASYHMWSAKAWGIALWLGFSEAFLTQRAGPLFTAAVVVGVVADLEGLAASLVLSTWRHDIRTVWEAVQVERAAGRRSC